LRDEFYMANESFALSPISARAVQPSEEDYAAISEAFMETARGRWFLSEYAKRNRNADTRLVLDAVARLEESIAAQKQAAAPPPDPGTSVAEAIAAIRSAVELAQAWAAEAVEGLALEQKLAPVRKAARVIREIAWRLREIGNDGRICDLIDSQVAVIENGAAQITSDDAKAALDAAFVLLAERLAQFDEGEDTTATVEGAGTAPVSEATTPASVAVELKPVAAVNGFDAELVDETPEMRAAVPAEAATPAADAVEIEPVAAAEIFDAEPVQETPEVSAAAPTADAALVESLAPAVEAAMAEIEAAEQMAEIDDHAAADAHDEAVLDMVAMEMGVAEPFDADEQAALAALAEVAIEPTPKSEPVFTAEASEPIVEIAPEIPLQPAARMPEPTVEVSLGSTIIASGIVKKPSPANDPLAAIRRMTQAEKIAFFS
jgi:hypothetical protein